MELAPKDNEIETFHFEGIPPFNQDFETQMPEKVREFKTEIRRADAILIATPQYKYSMSGVLKNAIDWASRPYGDNAFHGKPVAVMSAADGMLGGARDQYHLRQSSVFLNMYPINKPEVIVTYAAEKIDKNGKVIDEETRNLIERLLEELVAWTKKLSNE